MSRINTNIQSMVAQRVLGQNNKGLSTALERLSTGLRINRGKDDPAGLIASEALRAQTKAIGAAIGNAERADTVVNIAEGGLQEVSNLLTELQGLLTASSNQAGVSGEELDANQLQIDSILQTIDRVAGSTSFQGTKLLNGSLDYDVTSVSSNVSDYQINGAKFETDTLDVSVIVTQSAQQGSLYLSLGGGALDLGGTADVTSSFTVEISGSLGSRQLTFASGQTMSQMAAAINTFSDVTGVTATASSSGTTGGLTLRSSSYGTEEFVSVRVTDDGTIGTGSSIGIYNFGAQDTGTIDAASLVTFGSTSAANGYKDDGQDIGGTINGVAATGSGRDISINTDFLDVRMTLDATGSTTLGSVSAFTIDGGGADFMLAPDVDIAGKVSLGIGNVAVRNLGDSTDGFLSILGSGQEFDVTRADNLSGAQKIVDNAIAQVSSMRGRLGAFQSNVVGATIRSLGVAMENTAAAQSVIRDTDFASETAALTRNQILAQAATNTLSLANNQPQAVLQLLG
jgi:flagellin